MPAPVKPFLACQIVTLHQKGFWKSADELGFKANWKTQSVYNFYHRNNGFLPKKSSGRPSKLSKKTQNELVTGVLEDTKTAIFFRKLGQI